MMCVLTHRQLRPGTYTRFRNAWRPDDWWPTFRHGYHLRSLDDPDQVVSFAFYDATMEEFEKIRDDPGWLEAESGGFTGWPSSRFSARLGGVDEVAEEITPNGPPTAR